MQTKFNRSYVNLHGSDAQALIWKLRATEVQPSGRSSIREKISSKFGKPIAQLSIQTPSATIWTLPSKIISDMI
jgi:hypothetical protein